MNVVHIGAGVGAGTPQPAGGTAGVEAVSWGLLAAALSTADGLLLATASYAQSRPTPPITLMTTGRIRNLMPSSPGA